MLDIDRIQAEVGSTIELKDVLLLGGAGDVRVGTPIVDGASVVAEVLEHGRDKKILVFKYKNKTRYRRRFGHRQDFTRLAIRQILADGQVVEVAEKPKRPARKKAEAKGDEPVSEAEAAAAEAVEEPATKPASPRRRATRRKAEAQAGTADEAPAEAKTAAAEEAPAETEKPKPRRPRAPKPKARAAAEPEAAPEKTPEGE